MDENYGQPSTWLMRNSDGRPDFLFTILTFAFILLTIISLFWIGFGCLGVYHAGEPQRTASILNIMSDMKTGLLSLAGLVFGLAGSYTVRRFKKDQIVYEQQHTADNIQTGSAKETAIAVHQDELSIVSDSEDI